jgi:hypothetical protein
VLTDAVTVLTDAVTVLTDAVTVLTDAVTVLTDAVTVLGANTGPKICEDIWTGPIYPNQTWGYDAPLDGLPLLDGVDDYTKGI